MNEPDSHPHDSVEMKTTDDSSDSGDKTIEDDGYIRWFLGTDDENVVLARDILSSIAIVGVIGLLLFGVSGVWPPLVAVESPSMEPNMMTGDLIFVVDEHRFSGTDTIDGTGIVTHSSGADSNYTRFTAPGDVIIFYPDGDPTETPIIHRAHFWVTEGENWVDNRADKAHLPEGASCDDLVHCPASHDGFITKGDGNAIYDQTHGGADTTIVKPEWVNSKALFRIPLLGYIRLFVDDLVSSVVISLGETIIKID